MKKLLRSVVMSLSILPAFASDEALQTFRSPPASARPHTWWHWMNGNVSRPGITADLEAMAAAGLGGVQIFDAGGAPRGPLAFGSDDWFETLAFTMREAKRLGLDVTLANCSGWSSSGGPWVTPEDGMKSLVFAETHVTGPTDYRGRPAQAPDEHGFYRDIAVFALRTPATTNRIQNLAEKTFAKRVWDFRPTLPMTPDDPSAPVGAVAEDVVFLDRAGSDWTATLPAGDWTIVRLGYAANGRVNHPASETGEGLECDKLSASALARHFNAYIGRVCDRLGPGLYGPDGPLKGVLIDSYELGGQNWTDGFEREFAQRAGYDIRPFLPALAGYNVGSRERTEAFLADFRRMIADLFAENYAGEAARQCHARGLELHLEPYGNGPTDDLLYGSYADVPMAEFWAGPGNDFDLGYTTTLVPSLAHVWGRRIVSAEAFSAGRFNGRWQKAPFDLKSVGDRVYCAGVNRLVFHRWAHQPWTGPCCAPGMTLGPWGSHLERTATWWPFASAWIGYLTRCQALLQEGERVADILFWVGEDAPNDGSEGQAPAGYPFDRCDTRALKALRVVDGKIVAPSGTAYAFLVLPPTPPVTRTRPDTLRALAGLVAAGGRVIGFHRYADGVVPVTVESELLRRKLEPDFLCKTQGLAPAFIHRRLTDGTDLYFVALANDHEELATCSFRQNGREPEIWDPETGDCYRASDWRFEKGRTDVKLAFRKSGALFVVFRQEKSTLPVQPAFTTVATRQAGGPWTLDFPDLGTINLDGLVDWTTLAPFDYRHFSGIATYRHTLSADLIRDLTEAAQKPDTRLVLDLGRVENLASVTLGNTPEKILWRPPFELDVTAAFRAGDCERLEVKVANHWINRLIGDEFLPPDRAWKDNGEIASIPDWVKNGQPSPTGRKTFTTFRHWRQTDALRPSGLLGPVTFRIESADDRP